VCARACARARYHNGVCVCVCVCARDHNGVSILGNTTVRICGFLKGTLDWRFEEVWDDYRKGVDAYIHDR